MPKPYQRGSFRVLKTQPKPDTHPEYFSYDVLVQSYRDRDTWTTIDGFDYLSNARLRVRNLHAACCTRADLANPEHQAAVQHDLKHAARYINTGKLRKSIR